MTVLCLFETFVPEPLVLEESIWVGISSLALSQLCNRIDIPDESIFQVFFIFTLALNFSKLIPIDVIFLGHFKFTKFDLLIN